MQTLSYSAPKFLILHGHDQGGVVLLAYRPPAKVSTAQPNIEEFDDPQAAINRAIELGVPPELTKEFWPAGKALDAQHQLVDDYGIVAGDELAAAPPEPVEVRLEKLEKRLKVLEAR